RKQRTQHDAGGPAAGPVVNSDPSRDTPSARQPPPFREDNEMKHLRVLFLLVPALWSCSEAPRNAESAPEAPSTGSSIAGADSGSVDYVGLRYGSLPSGLEELGGSLLDFVDEPEYALVLVAAGSRQMLWLNRFTHRDDEGKAHWDVRAVLQ